jgi:hypothetical protein
MLVVGMVLLTLQFIALTLGSLLGFTPSYSELDAHGGLNSAWAHRHYPHLLWRMLLMLVIFTLLVIVPIASAIAKRDTGGGSAPPPA